MTLTTEQRVGSAVIESGCSHESAQLVVRILDMWELLEASARGLSAGDQALLKDSVFPPGYSVRFPGFEAGTEREIATYLVDILGQWPDFKGRIAWADEPMIDSYKRMLVAFDTVYTPTDGYDPLHVDDLIAILNARLYN